MSARIDYAFLERAYFASLVMAAELAHVEIGARNPAKEFLEKYGSPVAKASNGINHIDVTITVGDASHTQEKEGE